MLTVVPGLGQLAVCITLALASIYDIKTREIPDCVLYAAIIAGGAGFFADAVLRPQLLLNLPAQLVVASLILDVVALGAVYVLCRLQLKGDADLLALLAIAAAAPFPIPPAKVFPGPITTLVYYGALLIPASLGIAVINLTKYRELLMKLPWKLRMIYMFTALPVKAGKLASNPSWWYPLQNCEGFAVSFNVNENPSDVASKVREYINRGCFNADDYIWSAYGLPAIPLLLAGFMVYMVVGDAPLLAVLNLMVRA